jgi:HSP20 family protein
MVLSKPLYIEVSIPILLNDPPDPTKNRKPVSPDPFEQIHKMFEEMNKIWDSMLPTPSNTNSNPSIPVKTKFIGFEMTIGRDGKPIIRQFSNVNPSDLNTVEPPTDVFNGKDKFMIIVETPGMEEKDISVEVKDRVLILNAKSEIKSYYKDVPLPANVDVDQKTTKYNNGILEIVFKKKIK